MDTRRKEENRRIVYFIGTVLAGLIAGSAYLGYRHRVQAPERLAKHTRAWFESPRVMSKVLLDRYGPPSILAPNVASWYEQEPFKRITVHGDSPENYLEQAVGHQAQPAAVERVREFGQGVKVDLIGEEISARSNSEALNLLALNLANEVASGGRSPEAARDLYEKTVKLAAAGKSSPYTEKLLFEPYRFVPQERMPHMIGY